MVNRFVITRQPYALFGSGQVSALPAAIKGFGNEVILVTGAGSLSGSERGRAVLSSLEASGIKIYRVTVASEPSPSLIDEAVRAHSHLTVNAVVSIGGGSVTDAGKAISAMMYMGEPVKEYLEVVGSRQHPGTRLPFIAVPTTSGTGSEATRNAVLSQTGPGGFKRSLRHENFVPEMTIIDPDLTLSCPPALTAAAGMDCFTQLTEAYLSVKANEYTDSLALGALGAVKRSLLQSFLHGDDLTARSDMSYAAFISGICLASAGLGAVHGLAGTIGAAVDAPHGAVCGTLMAETNKISLSELRKKPGDGTALSKYSDLGRIFVEKPGMSDEYYQDSFIAFLENLTWELNLPKLGSYGLDRSDMAAICRESDVKNNPVSLAPEQLRSILEARI